MAPTAARRFRSALVIGLLPRGARAIASCLRIDNMAL
jgi:hypothetical protein